ncbi:MAG TPA: GNAT family protein, partial [Chthonomonadaceae bacterium]|nr:GNAT family protein [Chthonomonadaceae bacterium]
THANIPLLLRWIDSEQLLREWAANSLVYPLTAEQIGHLLTLTRAEPRLYLYTAVSLPTQEPVGHIEISVNSLNRAGRLCRVLIGPAHLRGKGLGTQMVQAMLRIGFGELKLHRIDLAVFDFNARAIACYKRAGFTQEGLLRDAYRMGDSYWSGVIMSMLEEEWRRKGRGSREEGKETETSSPASSSPPSQGLGT